MRFSFLLLLAALIFIVSPRADAQLPMIKIGAILPLTGSDTTLGQVQERALRGALASVRTRGLDIELDVVDSRSLVRESAAQAQELFSTGVHALICCSSADETNALLPLATSAGVPLLSLSTPGSSVFNSYWSFSLATSEAAALERLTLETPLQPTFLMTPVSAAGDLAAHILVGKVGAVRYPRGRAPLTPEALWAITRTPVSIVIWDDEAGTLEAARALAARGYSGSLIVPAPLWSGLDALGRGALTGAKSVLSPAALGYTLADSHLSKPSVASFRRALIGISSGFLTETTLSQGAAAWDALSLLAAAAEQVLAYNTDFTDAAVPAALRQSLRDALIGLGPQIGAGGTYDFSESSRAGPVPNSLVIGTWRGGAFRPQ